MARLAWILAVTCFCWGALAAPGSMKPADKDALLAPQQRQLNLESFDHVWGTIRDKHWDAQLGGLDWQAIREQLRPQMEQADTMAKARAVLRSMLDRLGQSHFAIIPAEVYKILDQKGGEGEEGVTGLDVRVLDGRALVTAVELDSPAAARGIHPGWQILKIDGNDVAPSIEKIEGLYKDSTLLEFLLARSVLSKLAGKTGETVRMEFLDGGDKHLELEIPRVRPKGARARFGHLPAQYVRIESRRLDGNIGYIRFNIFLDPANLMPAFDGAVRSCLQCRGIILDLRGNPGGIGAMAMGMAGWFIERADQRLGAMRMRQAPLKFVVFPRPETYPGPLAFLVDGASASTTEIFAGGMQDLKRARIFGTRTAGAALPSAIDRLPNGDGFQYAVADYLSEGGRRLEGAGVLPDVEAAPTRAALLQGRDPALEAALEWIRAQQKPR